MAFPEFDSSQMSLLSSSLLHFSNPSPHKTVPSSSDMLPETGEEWRPFCDFARALLKPSLLQLGETKAELSARTATSNREAKSKIWSVGGQNLTQVVQALPARISFQACRTNRMRFCLRATLHSSHMLVFFSKSFKAELGGALLLFFTKVSSRFIRA